MAHVFQTKHIFPFPKHKGNLINWRFPNPFHRTIILATWKFTKEDLVYWKLSRLLLFIFPKNLQPPTPLKRMDRQVSVPWSGTSRMEAWRKPDFISSHWTHGMGRADDQADELNMSGVKREHFKWKWTIFQPSNFRGYVSFRDSTCFLWFSEFALANALVFSPIECSGISQK